MIRRVCWRVSVCSFVGVFVKTCWIRISRKRLQIEARLKWTTIRKWHMANRLVTKSTMSRDPLRAGCAARAWPRLRSLTVFFSS